MSENRVLDGDRFEVMISDVDNKGSSSPKAIDLGEGARMNSSNLKIRIIFQEGEVHVSLGKLGEGDSFLELVS